MTTQWLSLAEIERRVCDAASEHLSVPRAELSPGSRLIEDLHCDSLDFTDFLLELEDVFQASLPLTTRAQSPIYKAVFTRPSLRLADLAELIYLQQGEAVPLRRGRRHDAAPPLARGSTPFTQLSGVWNPHCESDSTLFEAIEGAGPLKHFRRRSDGMRCVQLPSAEVEIGQDQPGLPADETPRHVVGLDSFVIDAETVSTTAYCRFLNSIGIVEPEILSDWFILDPDDRRRDHQPLHFDEEWQPRAGTEKWPMVLVSWYGANAYSLWANGTDWQRYRGEDAGENAGFLPSEAQWEYAARGAVARRFPWGDDPPTDESMCYARHRRSARYRLDSLPLADVNENLGMSPFGLHHMAGNVWQWCRDWYDPSFYSKLEATRANAVNGHPTRVRSERGGSWIGSAELCRSSFRRGRVPYARGRCLGFRCVSLVKNG